MKLETFERLTNSGEFGHLIEFTAYGRPALGDSGGKTGKVEMPTY